MKRLPLLVLLSSSLALFMGSPSANAAVTENEQIPFNDFTVDIPCTGDTVTLNGRLHVLFTFTETQTTISGSAHFQPNGLVGTDTSGHTYHGVGITQDHFGGSLVNGSFHETFVNNFYIIGTGGVPSYKVHETFHFTINAAGDVKAFLDHIRVTCQ